MLRIWKISAIALLAFATLAPTASARGGGLGGGRVFGGFYGPAFYPGFYSLGWGYDGWYGPWGPGYVAGPPVGEVKFITKHESGSIYIDGGYAGEIGKLKKVPLRAGNHTIQLRDSRGHTIYSEKVYVIAGKTAKIYADSSGWRGRVGASIVV